ncbi:MAG: hypothetical protein ACD_5C00008G0012 [uncultured bacterium]|nr:MAG: hypothetical protein ACD_5C00008G0012 [uncultured bacterium]
MTLCCVYNDKQILLGRIKKDGILKDRYNGFGGKVEPGETTEQAAERELIEEAGIKPLDMQKQGEITFVFEPEGNPFDGKPLVEVHIYSVTKFEGSPIETNEMLPEWFNHDSIPYGNMWPDDMLWLPMLLDGKNFKGTFYLKDSNTITDYKLEEI